MSSEEKTGVLFLAFGGAESLDDVEPFIANVLRGRYIPPGLLAKMKERYRLIGGKSPLLEITKAQAAEVGKALGDRYKTYVGMLNWAPYIPDVIAEMKTEGIKEAVAIVMAPFTSPVATGKYDSTVEKTLVELGDTPKIKMLTNWHVNRDFIDIILGKINEALSGFEDKNKALVIFSNHSLPREALEGDAYEMKIRQTTDILSERLEMECTTAYQSQGSSNVDWLGPKTEDVIEKAKKDGKEGVVVVPLCFAADHIETLYDIDILFKATAENAGLKFARTSSLNTTPEFITLLADIIKKTGVDIF
ncbi:MAG: ferrochelatase [Thermodesulfobacteriota bacterium]